MEGSTIITSIKTTRYVGRMDAYKQHLDKILCTRNGGTWSKKYQTKERDSGTDIRHWDYAPPHEYFDELSRISRNQIIWGGNYFGLPPTRCFVVWRKLTIGEKFSMAMCEYAWTSFDQNAKMFAAAPQGTPKNPRIHPTQKPVKLYAWLLEHYAQPGDLIFDSHVGSGSSRIACHAAGFDFEGCEIDRTYWNAQEERYHRYLDGGSNV